MSVIDAPKAPQQGTPWGLNQRDVPGLLYILTAASALAWLLAALLGR